MTTAGDHAAWRAVLDAMWADLDTPLDRPLAPFEPPEGLGPIPEQLRSDARSLLAAQARRTIEVSAARDAVDVEFGELRRSRPGRRRSAPSPTLTALSL